MPEPLQLRLQHVIPEARPGKAALPENRLFALRGALLGELGGLGHKGCEAGGTRH